MRLPRDLGGIELAKLLNQYGYRITRQTGSHLLLTTQLNGEHHLTIPNHPDLRVGTLSAILTDVADHLGIPRDELIAKLFGK
jgi:predicted RNA binding protein YcfA (HicA-like mRNA interferase family)